MRSINDNELPPEVVDITKKPKVKKDKDEDSDGGVGVHLHSIYEDLF